MTVFKKNSHEGFETFINSWKMHIKMSWHLLIALILLHIISSLLLIIFISDMHQLKVTKSWLFAKTISWLNPSYKISFPNPAGKIKTTSKVIANSSAVKKYVLEYLLSLKRCFYLSSSVYVLFPLLILFFRNRSYRQLTQKYVRGSKLLTPKILINNMNHNKELSDLPFGEISMPISAEVKSCFCIGRPGAGKTTLLSQILKRLESRNEKVLIYDFKGEYLSKFFNPKTDIIFNPLDRRSIAWNIFNELESITDIDSIAASLIPTANLHTDPFWSDGARDVFAGILHYLYQNDFKTNQDIWKMITSDTQVIFEILQLTKGGAKGFRYLETNEKDGSSSKQAISVLAVLMEYCKCFEYMTDDQSDFSIKNWLKNSTGRIFLTSNANVKESLRPILSLFIDLLAKQLLSQPDSFDHKTFILLDEFGTLQKLPSIIDLLTLGRSKGSSIWIGIQDIGRIDAIYNKELRQTIVNACGNHAIFSVTDSITAKYCSDLIGETEFINTDKTYSMGISNHKDGTSLNYRRRKEPLLLPSDISNLPDLSCVVKFSNYYPLITKLQYKKFAAISSSFEIRNNLILQGEAITNER